MGRKKREPLDLVLPRPLMDLIRECETNCVAGCCGLDAFARSSGDMLPWLREHQDQFLLVLDQVADTKRLLHDHKGPVHSEQDEFNTFWNEPVECIQFLREWKQLILEAARKVYGVLPTIDPAWRTSDVLALARGIYADRAFDRMPILADALQDAGCDNDDILNHCRDTTTPHARGCWVVDLVLGKT